jgi:hypothetical protein
MISFGKMVLNSSGFYFYIYGVSYFSDEISRTGYPVLLRIRIALAVGFTPELLELH